jgi:LPS O-antigen subunit length determinant protein (WzzB/FepE family)
MSNRESLTGIFQVMYRWRKAITYLCLAAAVLSVGVALWLPNYYQSTTVFYPASPRLADPMQIFGVNTEATEIYGSDRDLDRLSEISNSGTLVDHMVQKFRLYEHYDIDSTSNEGRFYVRETFNGLYTAIKNKNDAIEITVEDTDPKLAAEMANAARDYVNQMALRFSKESQAKMLTAFDANIRRKTVELDQLADSIQRLQDAFRIYSNGTQSERLSFYLNRAESDITRGRAKLEVLEGNPIIPRDTIAYIKADIKAAEREREKLLSRSPDIKDLTLERLNRGTPSIQVVSDLHYQARRQLSFDLERYNQLLSAYNTQIPLVHVIRPAEVPLMKVRPKRSALVVASVIGTFLFSILGVLLLEAYRGLDWQRIKS